MRTRTSSSTYWAFTAAALLLSWPEPSFAIDTATRAAARDIGYEGVEAYEAGNYERASERLERAYEVLQLPSLALWSARALEKKGLLLEASERYLDATRISTEGAGEQQVQLDAQAQAEEERDALRKRIPKVIVDIQGAPPAEVEVTIDGHVVVRALYGDGRPSNPGEIEVVAKWGEQTVKGKVLVEEGDEKKITLKFDASKAPVPVAAPLTKEESAPSEEKSEPTNAPATPEDSGQKTGGSWQKTVGWIAIGVGGAGLITGGITGFLAMEKNEGLDETCPDRVCGPDQYGDYYIYNGLRTTSSVSLIAGGVLAAAGVTLLITAPKKKASAFVSPYVGLSSAGVRGAF